MGLNADFGAASFITADDVTPMRLSHTFDGAVLNLDVQAPEVAADNTAKLDGPGPKV